MTVTASPDAIATLLAQFGEGKKAALARAVSIVENRRAGADRLLAELHPKLGRARRIGSAELGAHQTGFAVVGR